MFSVGTKATDPVSWEQTLAEYISKVYQHDPSQYTGKLKDFDRLRTSLNESQGTPESRNQVYHYLGQLKMLEGRIKIGGEGGAKIAFSW